MAPQLQQAIERPELDNLVVCVHVERELEQNPLLERDEDGPRSHPAPGAAMRRAAGHRDFCRRGVAAGSWDMSFHDLIALS
jgi:RNA polymerase sigma-54 factor